MWIMTSCGFYSIKRENQDTFYVRGRVKRDLENLKRESNLSGEVEKWPIADYRYRLIVDKSELLHIFAAFIQTIVYDNFKDHIAKLPDQRNKLDAYHRIWSIMHNIQFDAEHPVKKNVKSNNWARLFDEADEDETAGIGYFEDRMSFDELPRVTKREKKQRKLSARKQGIKVIKGDEKRQKIREQI